MKIYTGIGSRETPADVLALMTKIARRMAGAGFLLRSGAAPGADSAFEAGAGDLKEIYVPWKGFNGSALGMTPTPEAFVMAEKFHPAWNRCRRGARALHARNCHQVLGLNLRIPTSLVICWTMDGLSGGGTGQAIRIATHHKIPVHDLCIPVIRKRYEELTCTVTTSD